MPIVYKSHTYTKRRVVMEIFAGIFPLPVVQSAIWAIRHIVIGADDMRLLRLGQHSGGIQHHSAAAIRVWWFIRDRGWRVIVQTCHSGVRVRDIIFTSVEGIEFPVGSKILWTQRIVYTVCIKRVGTRSAADIPFLNLYS